MSIAAIVLAAGASTRMGTPKPLLSWGEQSLLSWELEQLQDSLVHDIVIVTGAHADNVRRSLDDTVRQFCVFNARWAQGRSTSLAAGAGALLSATKERPEIVLVQNVDQPTRWTIINRLIEELRTSDALVAQPLYRGVAGHPVAVHGSLLEELAATNESELGLRAVLDRHSPHQFEMDNEPLVRIDLDTQETLKNGRLLCGVDASAER